MYKRAITYGTFDLFHVGHLELLKRLKALAHEVYVGVSTDEFNLEKGKACVVPFDARLEIVAAIKYVDLGFPEQSWEQKVADIRRFDCDLFVMGDDWRGKFDELKTLCEVIYLPRTPVVSTTNIKESIRGIEGAFHAKVVKLLG